MPSSYVRFIRRWHSFWFAIKRYMERYPECALPYWKHRWVYTEWPCYPRSKESRQRSDELEIELGLTFHKPLVDSENSKNPQGFRYRHCAHEFCYREEHSHSMFKRDKQGVEVIGSQVCWFK